MLLFYLTWFGIYQPELFQIQFMFFISLEYNY